MNAKGIALVVVHGVADQKPGATADAVVDLLVASRREPASSHPEHAVSHPDRADYSALSRERLALAVDPLAPRAAPPPRSNATPFSEDRSAVKSLAQSVRCDFQRPAWQAPETVDDFIAACHAPAEERSGDRGIERTNYLLTKLRDNGAGREAYETTRIELSRTAADESTSSVFVYEMYWADLSRLSSALPRIVTELFTLVFRLSRLGCDTVDEARGWLARTRGTRAQNTSKSFAAAWTVVTGLQISLDWLFVNVLALLFAQLLLLALVLAATGAASLADPAWLHRLVAVAVALFGLLALAYRRRDRDSKLLVWPLALVVAGAMALAFASLRPLLTALLLVAAITFAYEAALRVGDDRFPFVHLAGRWLWVALLCLVLASAIHEINGSADLQGFDVHRHAALFGVEFTLFLIKWCWVAASLLLVVWLASGWIASRESGYESRASIATGRLGLTLSLTFFLTLTMALWALLTPLLEASAARLTYSSCIFGRSATPTTEAEDFLASLKPRHERAVHPTASGATERNRCLWPTAAATEAAASAPRAGASSAAAFLTDRYLGSTATFSLLAVVLLLFVAFLASMVTPSVLAELKLLVDRRPKPPQRPAEKVKGALRERVARTRRLGRWLTAGFRNLDGVVIVVAVLGVALGLFVGIVLFVSLFDASTAGRWAHSFIGTGEGVVIDVSQALLKPLVFTVAGIGGALTLLGGLLSRYLPALRAPLDVALDVDNHLREFPRTSIPRARIFSRYAALLRHIAAAGHERIVIVAHSQGAVISAELLRFLCSDGRNAPSPEDRPRIDDTRLAEIQLLTLGCPLRQLYAARFPTLYRWVIARRGEITGPRADDIGVARWINGFCSGDYVGRWLWSDSPDDGDPVGHPMVDTVGASAFGRRDAYDPFDPMPPLAQPFASAREVEVCLGFGAHTHYFDKGQETVAWLIDSLIAA